MAETLRDMVVSLSLNSDNFSANLRSINQQLKEADSQFKLAASGVTNFESTAAGAQAQLQNLQQKFQLQQQAVQQYERALEAAKGKLETSVQTHEKLSQKLETAKQKHADLGQQVDKLTADLKEAEEAGLKGTSTYAEMEAELEQLKAEYSASGQEVQKLEGQLSRSESAMQRNADAVTRANTNLNNARSALQQTQSQIDQVTSRLERMQNAWLNAADKMAKFGEKATSVGKSVEGVGKSMSKISAVAMGAGVASVKTFASYDDAIRQVYATMGMSESQNAAEMKALSEAAQEMGASTRYSASEAASALNYLALAGYDSEKAIAALPTVLNLAQAGGIDLASASDMVTDSMSALGLEMSYMPVFADQMAKASQKSNTSVAQLGEGILKVSATAKNLKGGTVELNTALGILADNGIKGAEGGTHLRNVILSLQNPTDKAAAQLKSMGVEVYDAEGNMRGLDEIFGDLQSSMAGWTQQAKDAAMSEIFNKTDLTAVNALLSNCGDRWKELSGEISSCDGAAQQMADTMEGGIGGAFRSFKSAVEGLAIAFGDTLAPTIKSTAEKITEYVRKFTSMDEAHKKTIVKIAAVVAAAGPLVLIIGKIITAVGTTATGISKLMVGITKVPGAVTKITSTVATFASKGVTAVKTFMTAVSSAGGGVKGLLSVIGSWPAAIAVFAAAAAYGIYKLVDWASGAKAAREAQERLNKTVEEWGNDVTTAFEKSKGLEAFGLSKEDFSVRDTGTDWLAQTIATWTDGKKETDQIVSDTVKGFTDGTEEIRSSLQTLKDSTGGTAIGDLDSDLATLDAIDAEVESILKKKQNGYLSDDETARLQALIDQRDAIKVKYSLVTDSEGAFQTIVDGVEAAMSRGADSTTTFNDAYAAATQGLGAFTDSLNAEYDARYQVISAMEDQGAKEAALAELRTWYNEQAAAGQQQYYEALRQSADMTGAFGEGGQFTQTADKLREINTLMEAAAGKDSISSEMTALRDALAGLDETSIVEMEAAIAAMESAAVAAGETVPDEVLAAKEALEQVKAAATDTSNVFSDDVATSLDTMFSGLGDEVHEVYASLNCDGLSAAYDAWAVGEHADIIPSLDTTTIDLSALDGLTGTVTAITDSGQNVTVDLSSIDALTGTVTVYDDEGNASVVKLSSLKNLTGTVTAYGEGSATTVDLGTIDALAGTVTTYSDDGTASITALSSLAGLKGTVTAYSDGQSVTVDLSTLDALNGTVTVINDAGESTTVSIASLTGLSGTVTALKQGPTVTVDLSTLDALNGTVTAITESGEGVTLSLSSINGLTGKVSGYLEDGTSVTADLSTLDALNGTVTVYNDYGTASTVSLSSLSGLSGTVTGYTQGNNITFDAAALKQLNGTVTTVTISPDAVIPVVETTATVKTVNFQNGEFTNSGRPDLEFAAAEQASSKNFVGLTDWSASDTYATLINLATAVKGYNQAIAEGDTVAAENWARSIQFIGETLGTELSYNNGQGFQAMAQYIANGMQLMNDGAMNPDQIQEYTDVVQALTTVLASSTATDSVTWGMRNGKTMADDLSGALNDYDWNTTSESVLGDIESGFSTASANMQQIGDDIAAGVGEGEAAHDFSADAETTIGNDETALRSAADSHSPAARFNPLGEDIAAGIGEGMSQHEFSAEAEAVVAALQSSFAADLFSETGALVALGLVEGMTGADMSGAGSTVSGNVQSALSGAMSASSFTGYGTTAASGVEQGLSSYSFSSAGSSVSGSVRSSIAGSLNSSSLVSVGRNAMAGLAAGIRSGSASVVSAMRAAAQSAVSAAKATLKIQSPSRVFRDEVGTMVMRGFGEGIQDETKAQARIIGNAARYLTSAAQGGISTGSTDNRRTYNSSSNVTLQVGEMHVRDQQDIRSLAVEIAGLTKTKQRGKGLRMA